MRVDYQFTNNRSFSYLHYSQFSVGSASEEYLLTVGWFTGVGIDWFAHHPLNGNKFTTPDNDNDKGRGYNCAASYQSGWWYYDCSHININRQPPRVSSYHVHLLYSEMKIRSKDCITQ